MNTIPAYVTAALEKAKLEISIGQLAVSNEKLIAENEKLRRENSLNIGTISQLKLFDEAKRQALTLQKTENLKLQSDLKKAKKKIRSLYAQRQRQYDTKN